jgi:hypothetical protein
VRNHSAAQHVLTSSDSPPRTSVSVQVLSCARELHAAETRKLVANTFLISCRVSSFSIGSAGLPPPLARGVDRLPLQLPAT